MELEQSFKQALSAKDSLEDLIAKEDRKKFTIDVLKASSAGTVFSGSTLMLQGSVIGALISGISVLAALYYGGNAASYSPRRVRQVWSLVISSVRPAGECA